MTAVLPILISGNQKRIHSPPLPPYNLLTPKGGRDGEQTFSCTKHTMDSNNDPLPKGELYFAKKKKPLQKPYRHPHGTNYGQDTGIVLHLTQLKFHLTMLHVARNVCQLSIEHKTGLPSFSGVAVKAGGDLFLETNYNTTILAKKKSDV